MRNAFLLFAAESSQISRSFGTGKADAEYRISKNKFSCLKLRKDFIEFTFAIDNQVGLDNDCAVFLRSQEMT